MALGGFKNKMDMERKISDFQQYLKLEERLNREAEIAFKQAAKNQDLGIEPTMPSRRYESAEQALQDTAEQKDEALRHLRTIFPYGGDALKALGYLDETTPIGAMGSELAVFNQSWADFSSELKGRRTITPEFFNNLWDRYKLKLAKTQFTGIAIPIDDTAFNQQMREQAQLARQLIQQNARNFAFTNQKIQEVQNAIDTAVATRNQELLNKLVSAIEEGKIETINRLVAESVKSRLFIERELAKQTGGLTTEGELLTPASAIEDMNKNDLIQYLKQISGHKSGKIEWETAKGTERKAITKMNKAELVSAIKYFEAQKPSVEGGSPATSVEGGTPATIGRGIFSKKLMQNKGVGNVSRKIPFSKRVIIGRGIQKQEELRYQQFGRYVIHLPSLKKQILNIKHKCISTIMSLPPRPISKDIQALVYDILEHGRLTPKIYSSLSREDKQYIDCVLTKAQLDEKLGIQMDRQEQREDIKRFELLRGEMMAGNDAEEIRKELKMYLLRFMNDGILPRHKATQLLIELAAF